MDDIRSLYLCSFSGINDVSFIGDKLIYASILPVFEYVVGLSNEVYTLNTILDCDIKSDDSIDINVFRQTSAKKITESFLDIASYFISCINRSFMDMNTSITIDLFDTDIADTKYGAANITYHRLGSKIVLGTIRWVYDTLDNIKKLQNIKYYSNMDSHIDRGNILSCTYQNIGINTMRYLLSHNILCSMYTEKFKNDIDTNNEYFAMLKEAFTTMMYMVGVFYNNKYDNSFPLEFIYKVLFDYIKDGCNEEKSFLIDFLKKLENLINDSINSIDNNDMDQIHQHIRNRLGE